MDADCNLACMLRAHFLSRRGNGGFKLEQDGVPDLKHDRIVMSNPTALETGTVSGEADPVCIGETLSLSRTIWSNIATNHLAM